MTRHLGQSDLDDLSAYLDGELPPERMAEIRRLIRDDLAWREACAGLTAVDAALSDYPVSPPPAGLAERILAGVAASDLSEGDLEDLSACLDGELPADRAAEVERLVRDDRWWRQMHREMTAVDAALEAYTVPAAAPELPERIIAAAQRSTRRKHVLRVVAWAAPAAAAAAVLLVALAVMNRPADPVPKQPGIVLTDPPPPVDGSELERSKAYQSMPKAERVALEEEIIKQLSFFRNYAVYEQFDTLEAIDRLESKGKGT